MGLEDAHLPQRQSMAPKVYDEERRIAYVGITRAKNFLFLTTLTSKKEQKFEPSPFLKEMFGPDAASSTQSEKKTKPKDKPQSTKENPVFERIQNLQRKAADPACTAAESDAAEAMAQKLMSKYNIGIIDVMKIYKRADGSYDHQKALASKVEWCNSHHYQYEVCNEEPLYLPDTIWALTGTVLAPDPQCGYRSGSGCRMQ